MTVSTTHSLNLNLNIILKHPLNCLSLGRCQFCLWVLLCLSVCLCVSQCEWGWHTISITHTQTHINILVPFYGGHICLSGEASKNWISVALDSGWGGEFWEGWGGNCGRRRGREGNVLEMSSFFVKIDLGCLSMNTKRPKSYSIYYLLHTCRAGHLGFTVL